MAQSTKPEHAGAPLTIQAVGPLTSRGLVLRSPALDDDGWISAIYSADGDNISPALSWTAVLEAESYALVVEDPDAPGDEPFIHWMIWDIPGDVTELARDIAKTPEPQGLGRAHQGRNGNGGFGWFGPRPPQGHGVHRYHFQLFALGKSLGMTPDTQLKELLNALKANAIASGELVGLFENRDPVADARSPGRTGSYGETPSNEQATEHEKEAGRGGLDADDRDQHAPHRPGGEVQPRGGG
ncbi:MAG: YbhB/YbcL family Raf kinase inhibitor-like protein [Phenylobacterium sp.]|uniref:YbhB/YbcL family Raf kinase inhibitor-like protein n=1 Tax=Phenylobacterium sp. TaxID=1871053 RepID=UPI0017B23133|nr:YbhB/YbcL family Raf kinase inhibitor-like protein [Phenylobacterium sp.]MBA4792223.1 YbhB/YbcL family Raf kinase inhibitor-like protein [Phenylobacterium sp.]